MGGKKEVLPKSKFKRVWPLTLRQGLQSSVPISVYKLIYKSTSIELKDDDLKAMKA